MGDRATVIAEALSPFFAAGETVLEIGSGKGHVAQALESMTGIKMNLVDVVDYNETDMPLRKYDGLHLPFPDASFDLALFVFVLHHVPDPLPILKEGLRVSRNGIIIAENNVEGWLRRPITRLVDSIPHFQNGVPFCYHAMAIDDWLKLFGPLAVRPQQLTRFHLGFFWDNFIVRLDPGLPSTGPTPLPAKPGE